MKMITINNSKEASIKNSKWSNPGAKLYHTLLQSFYLPNDSDNVDEVINDPRNLGYQDYLKEAYLIAPIANIKNSPYGVTPYSRSGCKYPHHNIRGNELVLDVNGVKAAYSRARQMKIFKGNVKEHLMRHIKELDLAEVLHIENDDIIEENFNFIESVINMNNSKEDYFDEASHGLLKSSFRYGINSDNGHRIKIVFDLNNKDIQFTGHDFGQGRTNVSNNKNEIKNINKTGNNDFVSIGTVKAIIDEDTKHHLQSVKIIGSLNKYLSDIRPFIGSEGSKTWDIAVEDRAKESFELNTLRLRELMVKSNNWNPPSNIIINYKLGQKEYTASYKATRPGKLLDIVDNMNYHVRSSNFNARGVNNGGKDVENKIWKIHNETKILWAAAYKIAKDNHNDTVEILNELQEEFINIAKNALGYIKSNDISRALDAQNDLIDIRNKIRNILNQLKKRFKYKDINESYKGNENTIKQFTEGMTTIDADIIKDNFTYIESFIRTVESTNINEGYIFSQDDLEFNLDEWSINNKNLLFITGQAGSGKSTKARELAKKYNAIWVGLDFFECTDPSLENVKDWNKKYKENNIEFQCVPYFLEYYKVRPELLKNWKTLMVDESKYYHEFHLFLKWLIGRLITEKKLFIIEGVQLAFYVDYNEYDEYPLIIMGSSMLQSTFRRIKRAGKKDGIKFAIRNLLLSIKKRKMFIDDEKTLEQLRDDANNQNIHESVDDVNTSLPKQIDSKESDKNGIKRKQLYIEFIKYAKSIHSNNLFGSVFDKDAFQQLYSFVPQEMRYFYRLANPLLCVLKDSLTFFALSELKKININNKDINTLLIFAADKSNKLIIFNNSDKKIYECKQENNKLTLLNEIANTFDKYIEDLIGMKILEESSAID